MQDREKGPFYRHPTVRKAPDTQCLSTHSSSLDKTTGQALLRVGLNKRRLSRVTDMEESQQEVHLTPLLATRVLIDFTEI